MAFDPSELPSLKRTKSDDTADEDIDEFIDDGMTRIKRGKTSTVDEADDSSDDEEAGTVQEETQNDDGDDDMFASDTEKEKPQPKKTKKDEDEVELMDMNKFDEELREGEDDTDKKFEITESGSESESDDEADPSSKTRKEVKLDAFNLKNEMKEGKFDVDGNYIENEKEEEDGVDTDWLNVKKKEIQKAREAQLQRKKMEQEAKEKKRVQSQTVDQLLAGLIELLEPVESPMEALKRLNKHRVKNRKKMTDEDKALEKDNKEKVVKITECCESLIEEGFSDVYELEREELMLKYREETGTNYKITKTTPVEKTHTEEPKIWEFRWAGDTTVHGPYTTREMVYWKGNYFQDRVEVRRVNEENFQHVTTVSFS